MSSSSSQVHDNSRVLLTTWNWRLTWFYD